MEGATGPVFRYLKSGLAVAAAMACLAAPAQAAPGDIFTFAGTGTAAFGGDGGAAGAAALRSPIDVEWLGDGSVLVADFRNHRVRRIAPGGVITTVAGTGSAGFSGDGGPATSARLNSPTDVDATADGGFLIADLANRRVRKVSASGTITTVAGNGQQGSSGNGGPATSARLDAPAGVAATPEGGFLVSDAGADVVRAVSPGGTISTAAGGDDDDTPDGGPATSARLAAPVGLALLPGGGFLVAEYEGNRVRRVWPGGTITRAAGTGSAGSSGDGGAATSARLNHPVHVSTTGDGGFLVGDSFSGRIRKVTPQGTIVTLAGTGNSGFGGDGGPAASARLDSPTAAAENSNGAILIADSGNNRLRMIEGAPPAAWVPPPVPPPAAGLLLKPRKPVRAGARGTLRLQIGCPADFTERCRGTIRLRVNVAGRRGKAQAARALVIARARFSVAAGAKRAVKLRLTNSGRRLLRKRRTLTVEAVATRRGGPNIGQKKESVTFKLKRKKRKKARGRTAGGRG